MRIPALVFVAIAVSASADAAEAPGRIEKGNLITEGIPDIPEALSARAHQYRNTRGADFADFAPDGGVLIATRFGETVQIHKVAMPLGARAQLTFYDEPAIPIRYRPGANAFLFRKDKGGDEYFQIFLFDEATGRSTQLTEEGTRNQAARWSRDGARLAWSVQRRGSSKWQIVAADPAAPETRTVRYEADGAWVPLDWSPDGETLLIANYISAEDSRLFLLKPDGTTAQINPANTRIAYEDAEFSPDGGAVFATSNEDSEFLRLVRIDLATNVKTVLTSGTNWNIEQFDVAPDGMSVVYTANEGGVSKLGFVGLGRGRAPSAPELPAGLISDLRFSADGRRIGFTLDAATSPADVWTMSARGRDLARWTMSEVGGLNPERFVAPELIDFPTFDLVGGAARRIPAFVYRPKGEGPFPVLISIHGGPESQVRPYFSSAVQFWAAELGIAVIQPNVRGSDGYGKTYLSLDNAEKREDSVKDIGALLDWIATQPDLDAKRVMVYGGSYGGYMVLASLVHYNDRLAGGIDYVGVSNFVTFLTNTSDYRRDLRRAEYGDERDPAMRAVLERISPLTNIAKITKPLLVIQGLNDPRVPASESEQVVKAVRRNGGDPWYLLAKDEGHGFRKKQNRDYLTDAIALFLERRLLGKTQ